MAEHNSVQSCSEDEEQRKRRWSVRRALSSEATAVKDVINAAFQADAFFKKPEYQNRFALEEVKRMMDRKDGAFLVCVKQEEGEGDAKVDPVIMGSLRLEWELRSAGSEEELVGHFSAVSVLNQYASRGIGKSLVLAAEECLVEEAQRQGCPKAGVVMEIGVINLRRELFHWYEALGYLTGKPLPHSEELRRIILPSLDVFCIGMSKRLR